MNSFTVDAQIIRAAQACQGVKDVRYYLNGICFLEDGRVAATNGHIAMVATVHDNPAFFVNGSDIPETRIIAIQGKIPQGASSVTLEIDAKLARTDNGKVFPWEYVDGTFPDIDRIFPEKEPDTVAGFRFFDPALLAKLGAVFPKGEPVQSFAGDPHRPALFSRDCGEYRLDALIMGMRHDLQNDARTYTADTEEKQSAAA